MENDLKSEFPADISMDRFRLALGNALSVSKEELTRMLEEEKASAKPRKAGRKANSSAIKYAD